MLRRLLPAFRVLLAQRCSRCRTATEAFLQRSVPGSSRRWGKAGTKGVSASKSQDFAAWYTQVITRAEMIEYHDISGCYILRPWSFFIWEEISRWLDAGIKELGVENAYFPCFVSQEMLEAEQTHLEGFAPEVAWVTKSGTSQLQKPIALRPTSETIMYPYFAKWIRSHRDLPLKINQWANIVRWEFRQPTPFLRSREFLWQEGHTAHRSESEALQMVEAALELYARAYSELLAVPVIKGMKSEEEKFAGSVHSQTLEVFIPETGRGIQAATSHLLGQRFAEMFNIQFEDDLGQKHYVHQTSWGMTTRCLGISIMVHGDDKGLVLPPRVAPIQVILIPIASRKSADSGAESKCHELAQLLKAQGIRAQVDDRQNYTAGWKFNWWELKGVPLRLEVGPQDMARQSCCLVRRLEGARKDVPQSDVLSAVTAELGKIHSDMLAKATKERDDGIKQVTHWSEVMPLLKQKKLILAPWCETAESEIQIKHRTKEAMEDGAGASALTGAMKSLCIPSDQPMLAGSQCFFTGAPAKRWGLFGRSY